MPPVPTFQTQSGKVYQSLRDDILAGRLKPGARLVRRTLGEQYGTSAIAVSEALWKLESDGLVESEPMYGSRVLSFTPERIQGELLLRRALETEVARLCAERASELPADALRKQAIALDNTMSTRQDGDGHATAEAHAGFHRALAAHCGSMAIAEELERVWFRHIMIYSSVSAALFPVPADWHQKLLRAILSGDPDRADAAMREHIAFGSDHLAEVARRLEGTS